MQYSDEFKQKVLATLGDSEEMRKRLDEGKEVVGRILHDEARYSGVSSTEIVAACESMNVQGIYLKAKRQLAVEALYSEWGEMYDQQHNQGFNR